MVLVIDNYDSFTYNLVQYLGGLGAGLLVLRNDAESAAAMLARQPSHIVLSPGPCTPAEAGVCVEIIRTLPAGLPLLGVCLGHQSIGAAFGGEVVRAPQLMHGKSSVVKVLQPEPLYAGLPGSFRAARYHSLIIRRESLPACLEATAETEDGILMGVRHHTLPIHGVQFHPESILTEHGMQILKNFLALRGEL